MSVIQDMADKLADDVLAAEIELGDDRFYEKVSQVLAAASIRVRLAERRGRLFLERALAAKRGLVVEDIAEEPAIEDFGSGH